MLASLPFLSQGLLVTLQISAITVAVALVVGVVLGVGLTYGPRVVAWPIRLYSDVLRGLPLIVLIFAVYYGLPAIGVKIGSLAAALSRCVPSSPPMWPRSRAAPCSPSIRDRPRLATQSA